MLIEDQPAPTPNNRPAIWDLVIADMKARDKLGRERYGTPLQPFNGRDALVDAYQEALDLSVYLRQAIAEREEAPVASAAQAVIAAMQADPDYAWSWHCDIAMAFVDAGGDHYTANQGAARFMRMFANVEPAHELPSAPAQPRPWVGFLHDEWQKIDDAHDWGTSLGRLKAACAIEALLRSKNEVKP